ncbi:hypothetical protein ABH924_000154 [Arthrobacter sp. GAS37]
MPQRRQGAQKRPLIVVIHGGLDEAVHFGCLAQRIQSAPTNQLPDLVLDDAQSLHVPPNAACAQALRKPSTGLRLGEVAAPCQVNSGRLWITINRMHEIGTELGHYSSVDGD